MEKFSAVENAFKNIKISTGVSDAVTFTQKFLNKESAYGELLGKIAENETRIEILKKETEDLMYNEKTLEEEEKELNEMRKKENITCESTKFSYLRGEQVIGCCWEEEGNKLALQEQNENMADQKL